jgi:uncharacterized protein (TIGR02145 family)
MSSDKPQLVSAPTGGGLDVTLNCPSVQLSPTEPKEFIIAVPKGVFKKGLCATVKDPSGNKIMSIATTTPNVTEVNYITKMPTQPVFNIKDFEGNSYPVAKIGSYFWTAENLRSTVYDTQSERAGAVLENMPIPYLRSKPFYMDPTDQSLWRPDLEPQTPYIDNLTDRKEVCSQLSRWGYLYNWAAAVGFATVEEAQAQQRDFDDFRQGICPNGWHVPSDYPEFVDLLAEYVSNELWPGSGYNVAGTFLKSVEGWSSTIPTGTNPNYVLDKGTDDFGFSALPTGRFTVVNTGDRGYMSEVGGVMDIISSTAVDDTSLWIEFLYNYLAGLGGNPVELKEEGRAVRCMKNYKKN